MIEDLIEDCPLNSKIAIEFEKELFEGLLIAKNKNRIKIKDETGIYVLTSKKLDSLISYSIVDVEIQLESHSKEENNQDVVQEIKNIAIESNSEDLNELKLYSSKFKTLIQEIKNSHFFYTENEFVFQVKKVNKFDVDEETFELYSHLISVQQKYKFSQRQPDKKERYLEILRMLNFLLTNNYFNHEIRYNISLVYYELNKLDSAVKILEEVSQYDSPKLNFEFLCFLYFKKNNFIELLQVHFRQPEYYSLSRQMVSFLIRTISETKAYNFLPLLFDKLFSLPSVITKEELLAISLLIGQVDSRIYEKLKINTNENDYTDKINSNLKVILNYTSEEVKDKIALEQLEEKSKKVLRTNGEIVQCWSVPEKGKLYYIDTKKKKYLADFEYKDIIEPSVKNKLKEGYLLNPIPVFCFLDINPKNSAIKLAKAIQFPKSIELQLSLVDSWIKKNDFDLARGILKEILIQYPDEIKAKELFNKLPEEVKPVYVIPQKKPRGRSVSTKRKADKFLYYQKANLARQRRNWQLAKELFPKAIKANENKESAIKDLASIYQREGDILKAIQLVEKHLNEMENKETTYNFLADLYFSNQQYDKGISSLKKVLSISPTKKNNQKKRSLVIKKRIAYAYVKAEDYANAKKLLNEILKKTPNDNIVRKWLVGLEEAEQTGEYENIDTLFNETDFNILMTGFSPLMQKTLDNCDYAGLKATEIAEENFTKDTLNRLRNTINTSLGNKPKERAAYRLTEAKLMQLLEPENEFEMKSVLAKYCNDMALSCSSSNFPSDVIRSYYIESFSLEMDWIRVQLQVSIFLSTFFLRGGQIILENQKPSSIEKAIDTILEMENLPKSFWNSILEMSITSPTITAQILWKIYKNQKPKTSVFYFLNSISIDIDEKASESMFKEKWNIAREKRKNEYDIWFDKIYALTNTDNLNAFAAIVMTNIHQINSIWLNEIDNARLQRMKGNVIETCLDYLKQNTFDEKERFFNNISTSIERLIDEIQEKPTRFSYEGYLPLLNHIKELIEKHFENILDSSSPNVLLQVRGEVAVINGKLNVEIAIINDDRQKAPIYDITVSIKENSNFKLAGEPTVYYDTIRGGEEKMIKLLLNVSNEVIAQKIGDIELICKYKARNLNEYITISSGQTISLYNEAEFIPIENIFGRYASSNAVKDESMFKGRDTFIDDIIKIFLGTQSKCVVIYGQKRSGKSSVLYHLKKRLNETKKTFCLDFSLGALITEWSVAAFYNKILSELSKELRRLKRNGEIVPNFSRPPMEELEKYPTSIFQEKMEEFIDSCEELENWKDRKLTVLIDEFTYLYSSIQRGTIPKDFMKVWKDIIDQSYFNSVLIGQDVMPDFMAQFPNQFGVVEDIRLNYLAPKDAKELIEKPIWNNEKNESRFLGKAIEKIIDYTAGNPYYIQIFCDRLVSFLNEACRSQVTELTVEEVAKSLTEGKNALLLPQFDNLLTGGDADLEQNPVNHTLEVLKQITKATKTYGSSSFDVIFENISNEEIDKEKLKSILTDLHSRQVISLKQGDYRIHVQLFHKWLFNR